MKEKKQYRVHVEYRGSTTIEVEADDESEAEALAISEADESLLGFLSVYGVDIEERGEG